MTHDLQLEPAEARVLGVLVEKALTTPDLEGRVTAGMRAVVSGAALP